MEKYEAFLQNKNALEEEQKRLALFIASSEVGLWDWDIPSGVVVWDAQCYTMLGYAPDAFLVTYEVWLSLIHPDDQQSATQEVRHQLSKGDTFSIQFRFKNALGGWHWVEGRGKVAGRDAEGNPSRMVGMHLDKNAFKEAECALLERDRLLQKFSEQLPGMIYQFQYFPDGRMCMPFASKQVKTLYGVFPEELKEDVSIAFGRVFPEDLEHVIESTKASFRDLSQWVCEYRVVAPPHGEIRWHKGTANPEKYHDGSVLWHGYISDITEAKNTQESLIRAKEEAEKATQAKSFFLANMSHEVRTPLNAIIGIGSLLEQTSSNEKERNLIEKMNHSAKLLLGMLNDVLDYAKLEADKAVLEQAPFCLCELLTSLKEMFETQATVKNMRFSISIEEGVPLRVVGDKVRLLQVLGNLVSNAIKFSTKGTVRVEVEMDDEGALYVFRVCDTGIGMQTLTKERLFEPFTQASASVTREYGGTGLGLSIVQKLIHMMKGTIHVTSQEGVGSVFEIRLPLELQKTGPKEKGFLCTKENKEIRTHIDALVAQLAGADFVSPEEADALVQALTGSVDTDLLQQWKEAVSRLEYPRALEMMKKWQKSDSF